MRELNELAFSFSALPQLLVQPEADKIITANKAASDFLDFADEKSLLALPASKFFGDGIPELVSFTQEVIVKGHAWSNNLSIGSSPHERRRIEVWGRCLEHDDQDLLHLSFQDAAAMQERRERTLVHDHYRTGLGQWTRMAEVFNHFEQENQLILDAVGEGIYGIDAEGHTTFINQAAERILGWTAKELRGKNIHSLIHHSYADGEHYPVDQCPIHQAFQNDEVHHIENEVFWRKDGCPVDVEYTSTPMKDKGHIVGAVVIFRDVTQKKQDQKRLLNALDEVESLKHRLELENAYLQEEINSEFNHHQIVGKSPAISQLLEKIQLVAPSNATVLISGESGTGKELIARAIHEESDRSDRSLIRVNCAAIPSDLFESEFFGHSKGAFTGATSNRPGRFELANGGTLFLDEVGEIPLLLQGKLLRVLQEQQFERVGESTTRNVDVRIIAATNQDLKALVKKGDFREDLYFRLNVFPIESVPLRERIEDIPLLTQHFLNRAILEANKPGLKISLGELEKLKNYSWPGNIRELENIIERQVILAKGSTISFDGLPQDQFAIDAPAESSEDSGLQTESEQIHAQKNSIVIALKQSKGKVSGSQGAAQLLGVKPTTLASRIKKYNIDPNVFK